MIRRLSVRTSLFGFLLTYSLLCYHLLLFRILSRRSLIACNPIVGSLIHTQGVTAYPSNVKQYSLCSYIWVKCCWCYYCRCSFKKKRLEHATQTACMCKVYYWKTNILSRGRGCLRVKKTKEITFSFNLC